VAEKIQNPPIPRHIPVERPATTPQAPIEVPSEQASPQQAPDLGKFKGITQARTTLARGILGRQVGNVASITVAGVTDTPNGIVERVFEHEPSLALLEQAMS
jgi:hypothetical protein